jgi:hypothetical protein
LLFNSAVADRTVFFRWQFAFSNAIEAELIRFTPERGFRPELLFVPVAGSDYMVVTNTEVVLVTDVPVKTDEELIIFVFKVVGIVLVSARLVAVGDMNSHLRVQPRSVRPSSVHLYHGWLTKGYSIVVCDIP